MTRSSGRTSSRLAQRIATAVDAFQELRVGHTLVAALDRDVTAPPFADLAVDEVGGSVEGLRHTEVGGGDRGGHAAYCALRRPS